jgi:acetoin utilization deacetylase AcuC-like enzyme
MKLLYHPVFLQHDTGMHPENPKRLKGFNALKTTEIIDGRPFLELVHTPRHIERIQQAYLSSSHLDPDTIITKDSYSTALKAVGATIMASQTHDFALVRPPGHHAYPNHSSGFCLFNNIAIATQRLVNEGKRVLLFDFDGHLGDGTSRIFYYTDQVLYWSIHQYPAFPGHGFINEIGESKGAGFTINVPVPPYSGDDIFMDAVDTILPVVEQFQPDVVAVSAGFDAYVYDILLDLNVSVNTFYKIGARLRDRFTNIFATLEGGYNIEALPKCVYNFLAGINGEKMPYEEKEIASSRSVWEEYEIRLHTLIRNLQPYWKF